MIDFPFSNKMSISMDIEANNAIETGSKEKPADIPRLYFINCHIAHLL
jgi:hypothetical protein